MIYAATCIQLAQNLDPLNWFIACKTPVAHPASSANGDIRLAIHLSYAVRQLLLLLVLGSSQVAI